jgi:ABC-2 type transport system permease protein
MSKATQLFDKLVTLLGINPTLLGFIKKELLQTVYDPRMKFLLFVMPCVQMTLFGVAISNEVKNIRLAANFDSKDYVLRDVYERAIAGNWFVPANAPAQNNDPFKLIQGGQADAVLVAPPGGFTRALGRGAPLDNRGNQGAQLQLLVDATNVLQAQAVESYLKAIVQQTLKDDLKITQPDPPIRFDVRVLYNPSLETSIFMVPGVMCLLMVMTTMILSMVAIVREKEMGTFEMLISAPVSPSEVIFGKTIPYVVLGMSNLPLILSVAVFAFHVPMRGSFFALVIAAFAFVCTCVSIGTLISTFCKNQQQANLASFLFMFPAIMFSGLLFPLENMPEALKWVAYCDPLSHYLALLRNIMLKGGELHFIVKHVAILSLMAVVGVWASFKRFHTTLQ